MKDYRPHISTHYANDDQRLYSFVRDSKIPHGTFDSWFTAANGDRVAYRLCIVIVAALMVAASCGLLN